jgi:hypothetical protein
MRRTYFTSGPYTEIRALDNYIPWVVRSAPVGSASFEGARAARALTTLERYLGWSALQQVLAELRSKIDERGASPDALITLAEELSGRDLAWARELFRAERHYDFAVDRVDAQPISGAHRSIVVVSQRGNGAFGPLTLRIAFADGQEIIETWRPGRDSAEFVYEAGAPVSEAVIDPDRVAAVDENRANNVFATDNNAAGDTARAWAMRWGMWLQDRLLLWSALL